MIITHNMAAMYTLRERGLVGKEMRKDMERLSTGYQINRASDDAAGLTISSKMRWQIRGLNRATQNVQDGVSMIQVADGALKEVHDMLQRMNELSVQAANDVNTIEDRKALQAEVDKLAEEITRIGKTTAFNGMLLFDKMHPGEKQVTSVAELVKCESAGKGYLQEVYQGRQDGYYPAAKLDFSPVHAGNIAKLVGKSFSFNCSQSCGEVFKFTFIDGDGTSDSAENLNGKVEHRYKIDIHGMTKGSQIVSKIWDYVSNNMPTGNGVLNGSAGLDGGLFVSHSNVMIKTSANELWISSLNKQANEEDARNAYPRPGIPVSGAIDASEIVGYLEVNTPQNVIAIQTGCIRSDYLNVYIDKMNAELLGVDKLDLSSYGSAGTAMTKIQSAIDEVSAQRSRLGAQENRLCSVMNRDQNTSENTQAAESKLRDTDYADASVKLMKTKVLNDVSAQILRNNNQNTRGVLTLFV